MTYLEELSITITNDYDDDCRKNFDLIKEKYYGDTRKCYLHHTAMRRGYVGVNKIIISPYEGKFGKGYTLDKNNPRSTQYCIREYWIYK